MLRGEGEGASMGREGANQWAPTIETKGSQRLILSTQLYVTLGRMGHS